MRYVTSTLLFIALLLALSGCGKWPLLEKGKENQALRSQNRSVAASGKMTTYLRVRQDSGSGAPAGYVPSQLQTAYGVLGSDGKGVTIAIVDAYHDPNALGDLNAFSKTYGLPPMSSNPSDGVPVFTQLYTSSTTNSGWAQETSLDIEWAHAMAPQANIVLVEAPSSSTQDLVNAIVQATKQPGVVVVSMSFGQYETPAILNYDSTFTNRKVTFVAASGDNGIPSWPSTNPNVLSVGGTSLHLTSTNTISSQTAWSGSGGGTSLFEPIGAYQTEAGIPSHLANNWAVTHRSAPDLSAVADPNTGVVVIVNGASLVFGGTSLATPIVAARYAAGIAKGTVSSFNVGFLNQLYSPSFAGLSDVTTGSGVGVPLACYDAACIGYDTLTGLGAINSAFLK